MTNCQVCNKPALDVRCSAFGAISHAYCPECLVAGREPWATLVAGLFGCRPEGLADGVRELIKPTLDFYKKTEADLWAAIAELEQKYDEYMTPSDLAMKIAAALQEQWSIGNSSNFCDEPADWDAASTEEIARVITRIMKEADETNSRATPSP